MTFGDMLTYEENCVKEAMALPTINVKVICRDTFSNCEMCGDYSSIVYEVSCLGKYETFGDYASCTGGWEDGNLEDVAAWLWSILCEQNRFAPTLLTKASLEFAEDFMYARGVKVNYDIKDAEYERLVTIVEELQVQYDTYYTPDHLSHLFANFNVQITWEYEEDERYDIDWGDDKEGDE